MMVEQSPALAGASATDLVEALALLDGGELPPRLASPGLVALARLLDERARGSEPVEWALMQPIRLMIRAVGWIRAGATATEVGTRLASAIDAWVVEVPLSEEWHHLSRYAMREELGFLGRVLLRGAATRRRFAARLCAHVEHRPDVMELLGSEWSIEREDMQ
jgi:hypothetical protein